MSSFLILFVCICASESLVQESFLPLNDSQVYIMVEGGQMHEARELVRPSCCVRWYLWEVASFEVLFSGTGIDELVNMLSGRTICVNMFSYKLSKQIETFRQYDMHKYVFEENYTLLMVL